MQFSSCFSFLKNISFYRCSVLQLNKPKLQSIDDFLQFCLSLEIFDLCFVTDTFHSELSERMAKQDFERGEDFIALRLTNCSYERGPDFLHQLRLELGSLRGTKYLKPSFAVPDAEESEKLYREQRERENKHFKNEMERLETEEAVERGDAGAEAWQ